MSAGTGCCGSDIKTCAKIIAIVGIVLSALSLLLSILFWLYVPSSISLLVAFILVVVGLNRDRPGNLTAANVILIINIVINVLLTICYVYLAIDVPQDVINSVNNSGYWSDTETDLRIVYSVFAAVFIVVIGLLIFAFIIFRKAREHLVQNPRRCSVFPLTFSGQPPPHSTPVYIQSPPYPNAAPPYSVAGYPSGYGSNLPMYPQTYNGTPQLPPRGYNIDTTPFQPAYPQGYGYPTNAPMTLPVYNMNPSTPMYAQNNDTSPTIYQNENQSKIEMQ